MLNWYVYELSADYNTIDVCGIYDIHIYLMKKKTWYDWYKIMFRLLNQVFIALHYLFLIDN